MNGVNSDRLLVTGILIILPGIVVGSNVIYSNDTMSLTLSSSTRNLLDITSSYHSLEWILKNNGGGAGTYLVSQHSPHGVSGLIRTPSVFLYSGQFVTIKVDNIRVPSYSPNNIVYTLTVTKSDPSQDEITHASPGHRKSVSSSVLLNLVTGTFDEEKRWPLTNMWVSESGCDHVDTCDQAHWLVMFTCQDLGSGLFSRKMRSYQQQNRLYWWHDQFRVGSRDQVSGGAWVSCCTDMVELEVEDVAMNTMRTLQGQETDINWDIVIPVIAGVVIVILIIIIGVTVCICRSKYHPVNSQHV